VLLKFKKSKSKNILKFLEETKAISNEPVISQGIEKTIEKINKGSKKDLLEREIKLLTKSASGARVDHSPLIYEKLKPITGIAPSPIIFIKENDWAEIFPKKDWLGLWDPNSELIFIPEGIEYTSHISLHEGIHSIQKAGYNESVIFRREKQILLEGVTEFMTVKLDGRNPGFYQTERRVIAQLLSDFSINIKDIALLNTERLYLFLAREYFSGSEKKLADYVQRVAVSQFENSKKERA